jgi:hypothetical protein
MISRLAFTGWTNLRCTQLPDSLSKGDPLTRIARPRQELPVSVYMGTEDYHYGRDAYGLRDGGWQRGLASSCGCLASSGNGRRSSQPCIAAVSIPSMSSDSPLIGPRHSVDPKRTLSLIWRGAPGQGTTSGCRTEKPKPRRGLALCANTVVTKH